MRSLEFPRGDTHRSQPGRPSTGRPSTGRPSTGRASTGRKRLAALSATMGLLIGIVPGSVPLLSTQEAAAGPADNFTLTKTDDVDGEALIGEAITYTITATGSQSSNTDLYNLSFRDVLPVGVDFVSAVPAPTAVLEDVPNPGETTVIWENVSDLASSAQSSVDITVDTNPDFAGGTSGSDTVPVGSTITNNVQAVASLDAFIVPDWSSADGSFTGDFDGTASATHDVDVIPFRVTKTGPEELLRGVHTNGFDGAGGTIGGLYTIEIENNPDYPVNAVTLVDILHPGLEFLGCGDYYPADNTTVGEEWAGSGPVATGSGCAPTALGIPDSVDTGTGGETIVDWTIGDLTPGQVVTVSYQAGIPLFENRPFATSPPPAGGLGQGRNLDNNTGPSTGEPDRVAPASPDELLTAPEQQLDSVATATGTYTPTGAAGSDSDTHVTESEDLVITKSSTGSLSHGTVVTTTLVIATSEYRDFADLVVRDHLPSALCFLGTYNVDETPGSDWDTNDCGAPGQQGSVQSTINGTPVDAARVREINDGGPYGSGQFEVVWDFSDPDNADLANLDADGTITITYASVVREFYRQNQASLPGEPVLAGDEVMNYAEVSGPDTVADASLPADPVDPDASGTNPGIDGDTTQARIANALPSIDKKVSVKTGPLGGTGVTANVCQDSYGSITWSDGDPTPEPGYGPGDIVCFELGASFPANVSYEGVTISDLLPAGYAYIDGSAARVSSLDTLAATTVASSSSNQVTFDVSGGNVDGTGNVFRWTIAAELTDPSAGAANDIRSNLQKMTHNNNGGLVYQLRDQAAALWTEPEVRLAKGVRSVNGGAPNPADFDGSLTGGSTSVEVRAGDDVTFGVDVWNEGNTDATSTRVQDHLPADFACGDVSAISDGGTCSTGVITWTGLSVPASTGPGDPTPDDEDSAPITLTYVLDVPTDIYAGSSWTNTAGVAQYQGGNNTTGLFDYYPANNIDPANAANENTDRADDRAFLDAPDPTITKSQATGITEAGNGAANRATIGELIRYTVAVTIPEGTTVEDGVITDPLPAGVVWHSGPGLFDGTVSNLTPSVATTGSVTLSGAPVHVAGTVSYALPTPYTNAPGSGDDVITMTFYGRVADVVANRFAPTSTRLRNNAGFDWNNTPTPGSPRLTSNNTDTRVVEPNPVIAKDHTAPVGTNAVPGETVTYRITVTNPIINHSGIGDVTSVAHDVTLVDDVPVGLTPLQVGAIPVSADGQLVPSAAVSPSGAAFNGVWSETNRTITWTPDDWTAGFGAIDPGATVQLTYDVRVDDPAVSSSSLTNTAALTASSLDQDLSPSENPGEGDARTYTDTDTDTVNVPSATIVKDLEPFNVGDANDDRPNARVGEPVDYEVSVILPNNTIAYDATLFDSLPSRLELDSFNSIVIGGACELLDPSTGLTTGVNLTSGDVETFDLTASNRAAWFLGDLFANGDCAITVNYTAHVTDTAVDADSVTNDAVLKWNNADQLPATPASLPAAYDSPADPAWSAQSNTDDETFTVVEPAMAVDKDVANIDGSALSGPSCDQTPGNVGDDDGSAADGCDTEAGATLRYTVTATSTGTSPAHDITVVDDVPVGLSPLSAPGGAPMTGNGTVTGDSGSSGTWNEAARTITWSITGPLAVAAPGNRATFDYDAQVDDSNDLDRGENLTNTVDVDTFYAFTGAERSAISNLDVITYGTGGTRGAVTPDAVTVEVHFPELSVTKVAAGGQDPTDARLDAPFEWVITVTNTDAVASAFNVDVVDVLPTGWTYVPNSATVLTPHNGGGALVEPNCAASGAGCDDAGSLNVETLTWTDLVTGAAQPLAPGQSITVSLSAIPQSAALVPDAVTAGLYTGDGANNPHLNTVTVTGEDASGSTTCCDPDGPGGSPAPAYTDTDTHAVEIRQVDLRVDKSISPLDTNADPNDGPYWFGSTVQYTVSVTNDGPDAATGVSVSDVLDPSELEFVGVVSAPAGTTFDDTTNIWGVGDLANGQTMELQIQVRLVGLGTIINIAQVATTDQYDIDSVPGNSVGSEDDQDSVSIEVVPTSLGDFVWLDLNSDGVPDVGEPGIPDVPVTLTWNDPATGAPQTYLTTTDAGGFYGVPLGVGLPSNTDITVTLDSSTPNLAGLTQSYDRDGTADHATTEQITTADTLAVGGPLADLDFDFGYSPGAQSLGDKVWWDIDDSADASNGVGDPGIPGIEITATWDGWDGIAGTADDIDFVTTTDATGTYLFPNLPIGDYVITVDPAGLPNGLDTATYDLDGVVGASEHTISTALGAGEDRRDVDFSYRGDGQLGDTVWFDHNGNGGIDSGEPGIGGVDVAATWDGPNGILGDADDVVLTTTTAANGSYGFGNLPDGQFVVTVVTSTLPGNMVQTFDIDGLGTADASTTTLSLGNRTDLDQDFGYRGLGSIGDTVFFDVDGSETDGSPDAGDAPIPNVDMTVVWAGADGTFGTTDDFSFTDTTDALGNYLVVGLPHGDYTVTVDAADLPAGLTSSTYDADGVGTPGMSATTLDVVNPDDLDQDFAYTGATSGQIGDTVWFDHDGDGVQSGPAEVGFSNVTVTLQWYGPDGLPGGGDDVTQITTTDSDGRYLFDNLPDGNYVVTVDDTTLPPGLVQTHDDDGLVTAHTSATSLAGDSDLDQDFGYRGSGSIGDQVWYDIDASGSGAPDADEPGLVGVDVTVTWTNPQGANVIITDTTDAGGNYLVANLPHGAYTVTIDPASLPGGLTSTFDADGTATADTSATTLDAVNPDRLDQDFSYTGVGSLGDTVWYDVDNDGAPDPAGSGVFDGQDQPLAGIDLTVTWGGFDGVIGDDPGTVGTDESADDLVRTVTTDANGEWLIQDLPFGPYQVDVVMATMPPGIDVATFDDDGIATLGTSSTDLDGANPDDLNQDFSWTGVGSVGDTVWFDRDGDGLFDTDEVALGGVTVTLTYVGPSGATITVIDSTDAEGRYFFGNLPLDIPLTITVDETTLPASFVPTFDADDTDAGAIVTPHVSVVTLTSADPDDSGQDFGYNGAGSLGDTIWLDRDSSGTAMIDSTDVGIPNVDVTITWVNPTTAADMAVTITTDADGEYLLTGLPHGDYTVTVDEATLPLGVVATFDADGIATASTSSTTLDAVTPDDLDQDFSYAGTGSIGDTIWRDANADGVIVAGEPPLGGVSVTVTYVDPISGASFTETTTTATDGTYSFNSLPAGDYEVVVDRSTLPTGYGPTFDVDGIDSEDNASVTLGAAEHRSDVDFGYRPQADLIINKRHTGDFVLGQTNRWILDVINNGPATAEAPVVITDVLPEGISFVDVDEADADDWDCTVTGAAGSQQTVTCVLVDIDGDPVGLAASASASVSIGVTIDPSVAPEVVNTASVSTPTFDPDEDNNVDSDPTRVPLSVIDIDKALVGSLVNGRNAIYELTVTNHGPSATRGTVMVTDNLPVGLGFVSATSDSSTARCSAGGQLMTCTNDTVMADGDTWTIRLTVAVTATANTRIENLAMVSGGNLVNGAPLPPATLAEVYAALTGLGNDLGVDAGTTSSAATTVTNPSGISERLAFTGSSALNLVIWSSLLLGAGSAALVVSNRRNSRGQTPNRD